MQNVDRPVQDGINEIKSYCKKINMGVGHALMPKMMLQGIIIPLQMSNRSAHDRLGEAEEFVFSHGYFEEKEGKDSWFLTEAGYQWLYDHA